MTDNPYAWTDNESAWAQGYQYGQQNPSDSNPSAPSPYDGDSITIWQEGALAGQQDAQAISTAPDQTQACTPADQLITLQETTIVAIPPASFRNHIGSLDYYEARAADFVYRNPGQVPPDYYFSYGNKYVNQFKTVLQPNLSPAGQAWVDCTLAALQTSIEDRLDANPWAFAELEQDSDAFRAFAFDTHPNAYVSCGVCDLSIVDETKISDARFQRILTLGGIQQNN